MTVQEAAPRTTRWFYIAVAFIAAAIVFAGFAPSFYLKDVLHAPPPLTVLTGLHGAVFTAWIVLFIVQASLVAANRRGVHKVLGAFGVLLALTMVVLGVTTAITAGKLGHAPPGAPPPLVFMAVPLFNIVQFGALVATGLLNRARSDVHKRLMVLATLCLIEPALGRVGVMAHFGPLTLPFVFGTTDLIVLAAVIYDWVKQGRLHPAFLWGGLSFPLVQALTLGIASTPAWMNFATWATR